MDLRSDTVTRPTPEMREVMASAVVGDDVYGEDPTIVELEAKGAELLGQEAALFCATGSLANLLGVWLNATPGTEVICDVKAHIVRAELGAHAALHGITTRTWVTSDGISTLDDVESVISLDGGYLVKTAAVELENTHNFGGGTIQPLANVAAISDYCRDHDLGLHLDGARLANACVALGVPLADYGKLATTVTLCLSKGLGAPIGTLLASTRDNIARARIQRKRLGGGWRQAGILAAAGIYALDHNIERLADDHEAASAFAAQIRSAVPGAVPATIPTNIVVVETGALAADAVVVAAAQQGLLVSKVAPHQVRAVTHLDVTFDECVAAGQIIGTILSSHA